MKIKSLMYKDDGKVETRLQFGDNLALVVSAPVRVAIEGDTSGLDAEEVKTLCRELEQGIARELDFRLFELCVEVLAPIKQIFSIHNLDTDSVHEAAVQRARGKVQEELSFHFVCEIERFNRLENRARGVLRAFNKGRERLTWEQWRALEALEEALYGGEE